MYRLLLTASIMSACLSGSATAQGTARPQPPTDTLLRTRLTALAATWTGLYATTLFGLSHYWYAAYPRSAFHFFNDGSEWLQMDKIGHAYTAYFESRWTMRALQWSGVRQPTAAWIGAATGFLLQTSIEVLDGYSAAWGASVWDVASNIVGSAMVVGQELQWGEQRISMKMSAWPRHYEAALQSRTDALFGTYPGRLLKDYNAQTYWISFNLSSFLSHTPPWLPRWLNLAAGYGAEGLLGGNHNIWAEGDGLIMRTDIARLRQFYLAPDVDLTRIPARSALLRTALEILNIVKIPTPALCYQQQGLKWQWLAF
ncbi:MAG: YfiM family protein [Chitinophagales bacterium]|nr:YfiM family protein [Chitinophagales bacterium]MDW8427618.1 DUF2279 domain-containing protein [Chitinophagales bacterium]